MRTRLRSLRRHRNRVARGPPARRTRRLVSRSCSLMVMNHQRRRRDHGDGEHHAAVFVDQDMAMHDISTVVVDEAAAHLEVARYDDVWLAPLLLDYTRRRDGKSVPPDQIRFRLLRPAGAGHRPGVFIGRVKKTLTHAEGILRIAQLSLLRDVAR